MGGAHSVAMCDGGQSTHRSVQESSEGGHFCLAQLRELRSHVGNRTVMLAQLVPATRSRRPLGGCRVTVRAQGLCQEPYPLLLRRVVQNCAVSTFQISDLTVCELRHRVGPSLLSEKTQRTGGQVVVTVHESVPPGVCDRVDARWAPPTALTARVGVPRRN